MRKYVIPVAVLLVLVVGSVAWAYVGRQGPKAEGSIGVTGVLEEVLGDLVGDGTITRNQSDAIVTALEERKAETRATWEEHKSQLATFWEDGILTSDEIAQLPMANRITDPDGPLAEALEDGSITKEELEELSRSRGGHRGRSGSWHRGKHGGGRWDHETSNADDMSGTTSILSV